MKLSQLFKKKKQPIFIHIPKTGGSTFVGLLQESLERNRPKKPTHLTEKVGKVVIQHLDFTHPNRPFKDPDLFRKESREYLIENNLLFMLVRNPAERVLSEFNFQFHILDGKKGNPKAAILAQIKPTPKNLFAYAQRRQTQDYQCKFLLGRKMADPNPVTIDELDFLKEAITSLPIHVGTTENYSAFLSLFSHETGIRLNNTSIIRKKTPSKLKTQLSEDEKKRINSFNKMDYELYSYVKERSQSSLIKTNPYNLEEKDDFIV